MYQHFPPISDTCITADSKMGPGGRSLGQIVGFYYFVLNHSKRFRGGNTAVSEGVKMVCGTPVVHFPSRVVHAFSCTTATPKTMYHP